MDEPTVDRVSEVLHSGRYVKGSVVEQFEDRFAAACGADHAVAVDSGTAAILLALRGAGIGAGDEVFVPGHTFFATVSPILSLDATPVFVDVDPETYTMDVDALADALEAASDPAAILPVHLYGCMADVSRIRELATEYDAAVIEDACQAHFATRDGATAGTAGTAGAFSFYPTKNMTVAGDGGMLVTDDPDVAERARRHRNHGRDEQGRHQVLGLNHRLSEVHAAVGLEQLDQIDGWNDERAAAAQRYSSRLEGLEQVTTPTVPADTEHVYHLYVIQVPAADRDALRDYLSEAGIETGIHYPNPAYDHRPVVERLGERSLRHTESVCRRIVSLPMHPRITTAEIDRVCTVLERYFEEEAA